MSELLTPQKNEQNQIGVRYKARTIDFPKKCYDWFLLVKEADGKSPSTIQWLRAAFLQLERFCKIKSFPTDFLQLRQEHILAWLVSLRNRENLKHEGKKLKINTVSGYWRAIRLFYNWCCDSGKLKKNPIAGIKGVSQQKILIQVLQPHHIEAMLYLCPPNTWWGVRDRAIILTLLLTGIRLKELANLTLSSINLDDHYIRVVGKGNKERKVFVDKRLAKALIDWLMIRPQSDGNVLWLSQNGKRLAQPGIDSFINRLGERAGITDVRVSAHTFRHTFAINMLRAGKDVRHLQAVLGHESLKATEVYVRTLSQEDAMEWHKNVDAFKGWKL